MKDRIRRTDIKKPSHRLKQACLIVSCLSLVFGSFALAILLKYSGENKQLTQRIDNYTVQINMLEQTNDDDARLQHDNGYE